METNKDIGGPFKYNGYKLPFWNGTGYLFIGIALVTIVLIYIFRRKIRKGFIKKDNEKVLGFKNIDSFMQTAAIITIIGMIIRIVLLAVQDYPKPGEHIPLHLCRLHMFVLCGLLAFKKKKYMIYMAYMAFLSGIFGLIFIDLYQYPAGDTQHLSPFDNPKTIWYDSGIKYYNVGFDSIFSGDYTTAHYTIMVLPSLLCVGYNIKITKKQFFQSICMYFPLIVVLGFINGGTSYLPDPKGRTNFGYVAPNNVNEFHDALGFATGWPQNIACVSAMGIVGYFILYNFIMAISSNRRERFRAFYSTKRSLVKVKNNK